MKQVRRPPPTSLSAFRRHVSPSISPRVLRLPRALKAQQDDCRREVEDPGLQSLLTEVRSECLLAETALAQSWLELLVLPPELTTNFTYTLERAEARRELQGLLELMRKSEHKLVRELRRFRRFGALRNWSNQGHPVKLGNPKCRLCLVSKTNRRIQLTP